MAERSNVLRLPILVHREGILLEVGNEVLLVVEDRGVEDNLFDLLLENKSPLSPVSGACPALCGAVCSVP